MVGELVCPCFVKSSFRLQIVDFPQGDTPMVYSYMCDVCDFQTPMRESEEEAHEIARIVCFLYEMPPTRAEPGVEEGCDG